MNKSVFIEKLNEVMKSLDFNSRDIKEVVEDYINLIEEAILRGEDELEFIERLGSPKEIARSLAKDLPRRKKKDNKIIAISPFIAIGLFFYLGFAHGAWNPGWMAFLLIPITAIIIESKGMDRWVALSVFISLISFILLGTYLGLWHPMWALFLLIPGMGFLSSKKTIYQLFGVYTLLAMASFIAIVLVLEPIGYLHFLILLPIPVLGIMTGNIEVTFGPDNSVKSFLLMAFVTIVIVALYIWIGLEYQIWHPTWLVFFIIPVGALLYTQFIKKQKVGLVAYMPFISVILFFVIGEYANGYQYSWLVFLLIPVVAILFGDSKKD